MGLEVIAEDFEYQDIDLEYFYDSYKVDSKVKVKGEWLSTEYDSENKRIYTTNVPKFIENRRKTVKKYEENTKFKNLIEKPIENLEVILEGMKKYLEELKHNNVIKNPKYMWQYEKDVEEFEREIKIYERGIEILKDYKDTVLKAFICMNKTFAQNKKYSAWRVFQLVFIVSMIPDIIYNNNKDDLRYNYNYNEENETELLFFPTGGGKTEAFLGCATFTMFYDRLVGKNHGVSTIIKYPLRLLSIQQLDRTLKVITMANNVLQETEELKNKEKFSLGYLVGSSNTPNKILVEDIEKCVNNEDLKLIDECPVCNKHNIILRYNYEKNVLEHHCENCNKTLPLYIIDDEIYRFLPTIVISIIDKMSAIGYSEQFKNLLGNVKYRCKKHGFSHIGKKCDYDGNCEMENVYSEKEISLAPTLFIQDELHLLKESLGAFSAHYESFCKYYISDLLPEKLRKKIKYIGATATISGEDEHIKNLYGEKCRIFPSATTKKDGSDFYSEIDKNESSRIIIGFAPYGKTENSGMEFSASILRKMLYNMYQEPKKYMEQIKNIDMSEAEFREMLFYYWTTIVYFNSKNDNNKLRNTFDQQGNIEHLGNIPEAKFNIVKMTGDEGFSEIKDSLNNMQAEKNKMKANNLILATSTISHGVDADNFNNIFFYGVPSNTAEYIQAYSRVGRTYAGMVIDIIRLARVRDTEYLKSFRMMHKYKDYLIDNVPINSKAINAMYHTLPGMFMGLLLQYYSSKNNSNYTTIGSFINAIRNKEIDIANDFLEHLYKIYSCENINSDLEKEEYKKSIKKEVAKIIENIAIYNQEARRTVQLKYKFEDFTSKGTRNMSSLRDVDKTYDITINFWRNGNEEK